MATEFESDVIDVDSEIVPMSDDEFSSLMSGKAQPKPAAAVVPPVKPAATGGKDSKQVPPAKPAEGDVTDDGPSDIEATDEIGDLFKPAKKSAKPAKPAEAAATTDDDPDEQGDEPAGDEEPDADERVLRATADYLIKKGFWTEVEDWENVKLTPELYGQLAEQQAASYAEEILDELMNRSGKYRKILEHAMNNGDPEKVLELFKQDNRIQAIDPKNEGDAETMIRRYYTDVVGWETEDVDKFIEKVKTDKALETQGAFAKKKYGEVVSKQLGEQDNKRKAAEQEAINKRKQYETGIRGAIQKLKVDPRAATIMEEFILKPTVVVPNTQKALTGYQARILQVQSNPDEFMELVHFLMDKEHYLKVKSKPIKSQEAETSFGAILSGKKGVKAGSADGLIKRNKDETEAGDTPAWFGQLKPRKGK